MSFPLVRDLAATDAPLRVPVAVTCRVLGFTKQAYYSWLAKPCSNRDYEEAYLINAAVDIHRDDPMFGYRFIADELTDITEHPTATGKLYLCAIKDVWSNGIVGYSMDSLMKSQLAGDALRIVDQPPRPRRHQGPFGQGVAISFPTLRRGTTQPRPDRIDGTRPRRGDNAAMESFFSPLQNNVLNDRRWTSPEQLRLAIVTWIERTYHRRRRQRPLGKLPPSSSR